MIAFSSEKDIKFEQLKNEISDLLAFAESQGFKPDAAKAFALSSIKNSVKGQCADAFMDEKETNEKVEKTLLLARKILKG